MKKEDIVNEIQPTPPSTQSNEWRILRARVVKKKTLLCFIYNADLRTLVAAQNWRRKTSGWGDVPRPGKPSVPRTKGSKGDYTEYEVFCPNNMKDRARFLGDKMNSGAKRQCFAPLYCFRLVQAFFVRKTLQSESVLGKIRARPDQKTWTERV